MPVPKKVQSFLDQGKVKYEIIKHKTVFTAYDLAQTTGTELNDIAKTLLIKAGKDYVLIVLPASMRLNIDKLKKMLGVKQISIVKENVMKTALKVKPGAITPFGPLYKIPVYVESKLAKTKDVLAGAGDFQESVKLKAKDLVKLTEAKVGSFGEASKVKVQKVVKKAKPKKKVAKKKSNK